MLFNKINELKEKVFYWLHAYQYGLQTDWYSNYQTFARVYLDEYPEQKELRKEWFSKKIKILDTKNQQTIIIGNINKIDNYFENR